MLQPISGCVLACFRLRFSLFHVAFQPVSQCISACFLKNQVKSWIIQKDYVYLHIEITHDLKK